MSQISNLITQTSSVISTVEIIVGVFVVIIGSFSLAQRQTLNNYKGLAESQSKKIADLEDSVKNLQESDIRKTDEINILKKTILEMTSFTQLNDNMTEIKNHFDGRLDTILAQLPNGQTSTINVMK